MRTKVVGSGPELGLGLALVEMTAIVNASRLVVHRLLVSFQVVFSAESL